jgi:ribosomal protein S12 methylthiotransferase
MKAIRDTPNVLPYLDLPLQHSHPEILRAMNRPWQGRVNDDIIARLKTELPNAVLRTTFIVGFPGETDAHFEHLCEFVARHEFDHVGVFTFSAEEGTAAYNLPNPLPQDLMEARRERLMALQQPISLRKNSQEIGKTVQVLIEQANPSTGQLIGRSARFSPEVDGLVYIQASPEASDGMLLGTMGLVTITDADPYDLYGHLVTVQDLRHSA